MAVLGLVTALVGLRLLSLALRTRQLPELALGLGLTCIGILGMPFATVGRVPELIGTPLGDSLFAVGVAISHSGIALLYVFTWSVFRRGSRLVFAGVVAAGLVVAGAAIGLIHVGTGSTDMAEIFPRTRPFAATSVGMVMLCFLWNGVESSRYAKMLSRRLALGLSDPVLHNRFQLWATVGYSQMAMCGVLGFYVALGLSPLVEPAPVLICAAMANVAMITWYLSFLPPARYLRWVRSRAPRPQ